MNKPVASREEQLDTLKQHLGRRLIELLEKLDPEKDVYVAYLYPGAGMLLDGYAMSANRDDYFGSTLNRLYELLKENEIASYSLDEKAWLDLVDKTIADLAKENGIEITQEWLYSNEWYDYRDDAVERLSCYWEVENDGALYVEQMNGEYYPYDVFIEAMNVVINEGVEIRCYPGYVAPCGLQNIILGYEKFYKETN